MKRKGFTLIELLAVIVVLAVIALIAVPMVLNTIDKAKRGAAIESANGIISAAENQYMSSMLEGKEETRFDFPGDTKLSYKGTKPESGTVLIDQAGNVSITVKISGYCVEKKFSDKSPKIIETDSCVISDSELEEAENYKEAILNGADPVLKENLIPVTIADNGIVKKADTKKEWYSYENKTWANAVVLFNEDTYNVGDTISESDIKQYYVWIPRYKYELWNVNSEALYPNGATSESPVNIVFENKTTAPSTGSNNGEWLTHPAFTSFDTNGIWVGKYESSYNEATYIDNANFLTSNPNVGAATDGSEIVIKPNVRSLTNKNVSTLYTLSRDVNSSLNSHMMKNSEWGAVAYLTYSNYGKCINGTCEEVYINNVNTGYLGEAARFSGQWQSGATITGCSGNSPSVGANTNNNACEAGYAWNEANNKASTTGNVSGIYDMSGGNWEYIMATLKDNNGKQVSGRNSKFNSGFNGIFGCPTCDGDTSGLTELTTGIDFPTDTRYYDLYEYKYGLSTDIWYDYTTGKLGDATKEIATTKPNDSSGDRGLYYNDYAHFPSIANPWFLRGGDFSNDSGAGVFRFYRDGGRAYSNVASRVVLAY